MAPEPRDERFPTSRAAARLYAVGDDARDRLEREDDLYLDRATIRAKRQAESAEDVRDRVQEREHRDERHRIDMHWTRRADDAGLERFRSDTRHRKRMQLLRFASCCVALTASTLHLPALTHGMADLFGKVVTALT
jgi:hypothetical protein